ncbi:MAG: S41 family peptidase, partial [Firmicutes bacterium]|nr:S41 family peptidase [Bacillota bacterium]
ASTFGEYEGVGMTLSPTEDGRIMVIYVTSDSPAKKGGVEAGEYILKVDGTAYSGDELDVAAANIRGKSGSSVTILFEGLDGQEIERTFRRAKIIMDTVDYEMLDNDIAYISIYQFYEGTVSDFKEALMAVSSARGLVVDLRDNPGGFVDVAVDVADMLMDSATLVYTEDHNGKREYYKTKNGKLFDGPVVLLVDEMTASASEILAAGMQDNKTAVIVGKTTYGKGVIQSLGQIPGGGALRLTMWQYFSPSGKQIHEKGVTPDYEVEYDIEAVDAEGKPVDTQLEKAVSVLESMM